jgi:hypothetical protein
MRHPTLQYLHARSSFLLSALLAWTSFSPVMAVECLFVQRAWLAAWRGCFQTRARQPNSAEYQQLVGALFVSGCMQRLGRESGKGARARRWAARSGREVIGRGLRTESRKMIRGRGLLAVSQAWYL